MEMQIYIGKETEGDMKGKLCVHIGEECSSGYKKYVYTVKDAAEVVRDYILDNCKEGPKNTCKYCGCEISSSHFCCESCFKEFEAPRPLHGIRLVEDEEDY